MDITIVKKEINKKFPKWGKLSIRPMENSGNDNITYYLGDDMTIRIPSARRYEPQIEKEVKWLKVLAKNITVDISSNIALVEASVGIPSRWSINKYIQGDVATRDNIEGLKFARGLNGFLKQLQSVDIKGAPVSGIHNFYRGSHPSIYEREVEKALVEIEGNISKERLFNIWRSDISSIYSGSLVWLHGDIAPNNLLVEDGGLCGVIDFGIMSIGDPACDYSIAWTFFNKEERELFLKGLDSGLVKRARAWALWKSLITYNSDNKKVREVSHYAINEILKDVVERM